MLSLIYPEVFVVFSCFCVSVRFSSIQTASLPVEFQFESILHQHVPIIARCASRHEHTHITHPPGYCLLNSNTGRYFPVISLLYLSFLGRRVWAHYRHARSYHLIRVLTAILYDAATHSLRSGIFWFIYIMPRGNAMLRRLLLNVSPLQSLLNLAQRSVYGRMGGFVVGVSTEIDFCT
jgi:hypothetical protein